MTIERFFAYARERHAIYLRRAAGQPAPWTEGPILQKHKFTNVFRELDRTTVWFREHVRDRLRDKPEVLPATVIFRWFNRISTGEALFCQMDLFDGQSGFDRFLQEWERGAKVNAVSALRRSIISHCGAGPYVTGAYTINTISAGLGKTKLDGVLDLIRQWFETHADWRSVAQGMMDGKTVSLYVNQPFDMETFCDWCRSPCLGDFMTYEIACDLRHTALLANAPDINTWANLGPGARRGLNRIFRGLTGKAADKAIPRELALEEMRELLAASREGGYWPNARNRLMADAGEASSDWPPWEMREVEHTLCELDKYCRIQEGSGRSRGSAPRG